MRWDSLITSISHVIIFFSSRRQNTRSGISDWGTDVCASDLLLAIDVEQPREEEAARGARVEQVAVVRARPVAVDAATPDFIARAIIADRRGDANRDHIVPRARGQRLFDTRDRKSTRLNSSH